MVIGIPAFITSLEITKQNLLLDFPVALIILSILLIPSFIKKKVYRVQGIILLVSYITYLIFLYGIYLS